MFNAFWRLINIHPKNLSALDDVDSNFNLAVSVYQNALNHPDSVAVADLNACLTFEALAKQASKVAGQIQNLEKRPRARIALLASRSVHACVGLLGISWSGATYVPINLKWPPQRMIDVIKRCDVSVIVTDDHGLGKLSPEILSELSVTVLHAGTKDSALDNCIDLKDLPQADIVAPAMMREDDVAYVMFTSGTTGEPKGVVIRCGAVKNYCQEMSKVLGLQGDDKALETCELSFDVSIHNMFVTWEVGAQVHILPATHVMNAVKFVNNAKLTVWNSVPSLAGMLIQIKALAPDSLKDLRLTVFGGEQLSSGVVKAWRTAAPKSRVFNLYGPTEATVFCAFHEVKDSDTQPDAKQVVSIGKPLSGSELAIFTEGQLHHASATKGELLIAGQQLAVEYFQRPDLTDAAFVMIGSKRWYRTGDLAEMDDKGLFHCLGRLDHQVKILGHRVELEEIDSHVRSVSGIEIVATVAWPIDVFGNAKGTVSFVLGQEIDEDDLLAKLRQRIASYLIPTQIIGLTEMPLNTSGKVDRKALLHRVSNQSL